MILGKYIFNQGRSCKNMTNTIEEFMDDLKLSKELIKQYKELEMSKENIYRDVLVKLMEKYTFKEISNVECIFNFKNFDEFMKDLDAALATFNPRHVKLSVLIRPMGANKLRISKKR